MPCERCFATVALAIFEQKACCRPTTFRTPPLHPNISRYIYRNWVLHLAAYDKNSAASWNATLRSEREAATFSKQPRTFRTNFFNERPASFAQPMLRCFQVYLFLLRFYTVGERDGFYKIATEEHQTSLSLSVCRHMHANLVHWADTTPEVIGNDSRQWLRLWIFVDSSQVFAFLVKFYSAIPHIGYKKLAESSYFTILVMVTVFSEMSKKCLLLRLL